MQRRDTFNTTTSTGFSSSQNTSESFWRRYSNRTSSQKYFVKKESKKIKEENVQQMKVGEIINVENTRRNSMKFVAALNEANNDAGVEVHNNHCSNELSIDTANENNKQIQILNLDVKTNNVYSITLDVSDSVEGRNKFVCIPTLDKEKNIFIYDYKTKESFVWNTLFIGFSGCWRGAT